jgi:ATP-dependent RNA helicase SUPV3L1/SUV3
MLADTRGFARSGCCWCHDGVGACRIVFATLQKFDGEQLRPLTASEVKQIAGRAGRFSSGRSAGYVSVLQETDLPVLRAALATATPDITLACLMPR